MMFIRPLIFLFIVTITFCSCGTAPFGGGGCTPGPRGTHAFMTYTGYLSPSSNAADIYYQELDKTHLTQLSHFVQSNGTGFSGYSVFSNGINVTFASDSGGQKNSHIYSIGLNGQGMKSLTYGAWYDIFPSSPPNGQQIVFVRSNSPQGTAKSTSKLYIIEAPQFTPRQLSPLAGVGNYGHSCWTTDQSKILFDFTDSTGIPHIYAINPDGTRLVQLTHSQFGEEYPVISPDGKTVAVASFMDVGHNEQEICFMNTDGSNLHKITNLGSTTVAHMPCWSPVGDQIFFSCFDRTKPEPPHIFSAKIDGTNVQQFTKGSGEVYPFAGFVSGIAM